VLFFDLLLLLLTCKLLNRACKEGEDWAPDAFWLSTLCWKMCKFDWLFCLSKVEEFEFEPVEVDWELPILFF
jgi:hypothetical protein